VLDFFGGTGTTAAVSMKMGRRFIICEQLDKHIDIAVRRLNKVIDGEQSGISRHNDWKGGGSFVYCELSELNQSFVSEIQDAKNDRELADVWKNIRETGFVSCYINPKDIDENAKDFMALSFEDKKRLFMELLDVNQLYINYCDIDDKSFEVSDEDKAFTKSFYGDR
jgi:adenine-specific DNA-methyltransferase